MFILVPSKKVEVVVVFSILLHDKKEPTTTCTLVHKVGLQVRKRERCSITVTETGNIQQEIKSKHIINMHNTLARHLLIYCLGL